MTERDAPGSISRERQRDGSIRYRPRIRIEGQRQSLGLYDRCLTYKDMRRVRAHAYEEVAEDLRSWARNAHKFVTGG